MKSVHGKIVSEIEREKVIPFARFMELALYCPNSGFYEQEADNIGNRGDFFTSVSVGSLFGALLAFQFAEWVEPRAKTGNAKCKIIETGAHDGKLARDILDWLREFRPRTFEAVQYWIIEPSARRCDWQSKNLLEFEKHVYWVSSLDEMEKKTGGVHGVIFSNEFLDSFPVHRLGWDSRKREWFEWGVAVRAEKFTWMRMPDRFVPDFGIDREELNKLLDVLPDGFIVEICPAVAEWWRHAARILTSGKLLTFDYGLTTEDFFSPSRANGTLRAYYKHHLNPDVLANPGEQDITAHVNFTALQNAGEVEGLKTETLMTQEQFLTRIAQMVWKNPAASHHWDAACTKQFQTLTHPQHLGRAFSVLVQSR